MAAEIREFQAAIRAAGGASMRPRRMAAEIMEVPDSLDDAVTASMRPRRMAAEITGEGGRHEQGDRRFNEAAANGRGNRGRQDGRRPARGASMRPRRMAAEIASGEEKLEVRALLLQ